MSPNSDSPTSDSIEAAYRIACEAYAEWGVDIPRALERLQAQAISLHCWQGDDVGGFEGRGDEIGGGLAVTGAYPGKATTPEQLRQDLEMVYALLPGKHRLNLHASYAETGGLPVERNALTVEHFRGWMEWGSEQAIGLDFNPTFFAHQRAADGFTLAHADRGVRQFWIEHGQACRRIGAEMGRRGGAPCVNNVWIPDGWKDAPADRSGPRERLVESLDELFQESFDSDVLLDAVESKLFGIGAESYTVGSHEFYLGYAASRQIVLCLDTGHFHPTELVSDKISAVMLYVPRLLLHVSRGVRWDSDHVVTYSDELQEIAKELVRGDFLARTHIGLDFFDASINRLAAWVIGTRNVLKALLCGLLEPSDQLRRLEADGDLTGRLAVLEELKSLPFGAVWNYHCLSQGVPVGCQWLERVRRYEQQVLFKR